MIAASNHSKLRPNETLATVTARANRSLIPAKRLNPIRSSPAFMVFVTDSGLRPSDAGPSHWLP
ncbi:MULTISPECIES: hypothetical protein [unclassified Bradyrhizobium]|uniref:hypothetical protein n=1 Tax=unclassified Bradyrhizobium TaxID=2631580 RepID=UPI001FF88037|nr:MULTISPECIES: hypothetical protein [unclassified Bradyrhizobium]